MILLLAAGGAVWVVLEGLFALHGWPSVSRYLFEPVALMGVLAGIFIGWIVLELPPLLRRLAPARLSPVTATKLGNWGVALVLVALAGSMLHPAVVRLRIERTDLKHERARTQELGRLQVVVDRLGASHILACGQPNVPIGYQSAFAWYTGTNTGSLYVILANVRKHPRPLVNFYPLSNGWKVNTSFVSPEAAARCSGLRLTYRS